MKADKVLGIKVKLHRVSQERLELSRAKQRWNAKFWGPHVEGSGLTTRSGLAENAHRTPSLPHPFPNETQSARHGRCPWKVQGLRDMPETQEGRKSYPASCPRARAKLTRSGSAISSAPPAGSASSLVCHAAVTTVSESSSTTQPLHHHQSPWSSPASNANQIPQPSRLSCPTTSPARLMSPSHSASSGSSTFRMARTSHQPRVNSPPAAG